jgi:glycosyltransferase involved in cell wall biosynthesis
LDSVFAQTLPATEIIVVNDGSTDKTLQILEAYKDRIIVVNQENQGGNAARNNGFAASTGERIIFCDADVVMQPQMLEKMSGILDRHPEVSYVYCRFRFGWKEFPSFPFSGERLKRMNFIHTTSLIRRADFPGFDPAIKRFQDWDVWLSLLEQGKIGMYIPEELFRIIEGRGRKGISQWRPSFLHQINWGRLGWAPPSIRRYDEAKAIIINKHHLQ